ncbi:alpha/beta hydrolase [Aquimarina sp. TRL1]|uniref:alpha/beta fold hydrolase n=1 Tax=Aquimarina sp. (strain TRL1) TaxID=2736252 RepID=UPI00158A0452|nr:alpha/beta hydrolase [Aquimarina sp. TRL1]QKX06263.1 alpha/beta hydrolase [Aquimarina sp. TRL1]
MKEQVTNIYFVPGMAADVSIFEFIKLPEDSFKIHVIPWKIPYKKESMGHYAKRMSEEVKHDNCVLVGVSFGGVVAQEMSKFLKLKKLIIISSVKSKHEFPKRMKFVKKIKMYRAFPTAIVSKIENWEKYAFGDFSKKRAKMYQKYLSIKDKQYLDWALEKMICWEQEEPPRELVHIHGDHDIVFPISNIKDCITVENGTHVMIVNRAKWFNEHLPEIINN